MEFREDGGKKDKTVETGKSIILFSSIYWPSNEYNKCNKWSTNGAFDSDFMAQHTHDTRLQIVSHRKAWICTFAVIYKLFFHAMNALLQSRHIALMKEAFKE